MNTATRIVRVAPLIEESENMKAAIPGVNDRYILANRETERILQAKFYSNLMVKAVYQIPDEVCWLNQEVYATQGFFICDRPPRGECRGFVILGTLLHEDVQHEVEVGLDLEHNRKNVPRWKPASSITLFKVKKDSPRTQWELRISGPKGIMPKND